MSFEDVGRLSDSSPCNRSVSSSLHSDSGAVTITATRFRLEPLPHRSSLAGETQPHIGKPISLCSRVVCSAPQSHRKFVPCRSNWRLSYLVAFVDPLTPSYAMARRSHSQSPNRPLRHCFQASQTPVFSIGGSISEGDVGCRRGRTVFVFLSPIRLRPAADRRVGTAEATKGPARPSPARSSGRQTGNTVSNLITLPSPFVSLGRKYSEGPSLVSRPFFVAERTNERLPSW